MTETGPRHAAPPTHRQVFRLLLTAALAALTAACTVVPSDHAGPASEPAVAAGDPARSFWRDQVHYAYPVKYATVADGRGVSWEIAYMDEYRGGGEREQARTLVLIHGKGANAGSFSQLMGDALEAGIRVIAFDLPNYGKSIPGNLDRPVARTLNDTREAVHTLLVEQLRIDKAKELLRTSNLAIAEVAYSVGYPDNSYFSALFKRAVTLSPKDYRSLVRRKIFKVDI
jgi:hypothetical protein